jgi:putative transposase
VLSEIIKQELVTYNFKSIIMANTYHKMYIQTVFAVKYREAIIANEWKQELMSVIGNLINETGCKTILVNGIEDHVHCFFGLKPSISVSDVMKSAKSKSSKWINENGLLQHRFEWQQGFGAFSYSRWDVDTIYHYIKNQEIHHKSEKFKDEYNKLLKDFDVEFDEDYLFEDLI